MNNCKNCVSEWVISKHPGAYQVEDLITLIAKEIKDSAIVESGIENEFAVLVSTVDKAIQDLFIQQIRRG